MFSEQLFWGIYSQPWLQAMVGLRAEDGPPRARPGMDPDHQAYVQQRIAELRGSLAKGGPREAAIRAMLYVRLPKSAADERGFEMLRRIRKARADDITLDEFKQIIREQYFMLLLDERGAVEAIPALLKGHAKTAPQLWEDIRKVVTAAGDLEEESLAHMKEIEPFFLSAPRKKRKPAARKSTAKRA